MKLPIIFFSVAACTVLTMANDFLTLSGAHELALKNEPKLKALMLKTESAKEYVTQSKARLYPQLQGNVTWGRYEYQYVSSETEVKEDYLSYSLSATQPVFHPELWRGIDESKSREAAARYDLYDKSQQLGLDVTKAYFQLLRTYRNIELLSSQKEYYESKYKQLDEMLKLGLTNKVDMLESKIKKDKITAEWLAEQKRLYVAKMRLKNLTKSDITELPSFNFTMIDIPLIFKERAVWESKLENSPTLKGALAKRDMSQHQLAINEYGHYPKLDLSLTRKDTSTQDRISHEYDNQVVVQMSIPIYSGGYTQSKVRESLLIAESTQQELESAELDAKLHFEELWADYELAAQTLDVLHESEKSAELFLAYVEKSHQSGLKSIVDVLEAKTKLFEIKRDIIDAGFTLVNDYLGLLAVSGELNSENIIALEKIIVQQGEKL